MQKLKDLYTKLKQFLPFVLGLLAPIVIAVGVFLLKRRLQTQQAELAKLRTNAEQTKVRALTEAYKADLEVNEAKKEELKKAAFLANIKATRDIEHASKLEVENKKALDKINEIKSWSELDALNKTGR